MKIVYERQDRRSGKKGPMITEDESQSPVLLQEAVTHPIAPPLLKSHTGYAFS